MTSVFIRRGELETQRRRRTSKAGDRDLNNAGKEQARGGWESSKAGRGKKKFFSRACRGSMALLTP